MLGPAAFIFALAAAKTLCCAAWTCNICWGGKRAALAGGIRCCCEMLTWDRICGTA